MIVEDITSGSEVILTDTNSKIRPDQRWKRSAENEDGWFTLRHAKSSLFLNRQSEVALTIEGNNLHVVCVKD